MSIPFQLQLLFANLQLGHAKAVTTKALTKSFGWTSSDAFQQHDVQELARVLFDALEECLAGTSNSHLMQNLSRGMLRDFVRCTQCGHERSREDIILDLSLAIKPFGSQKVMGSIEEALAVFVMAATWGGSGGCL